jgi:hypothetical protein
MFACLKSSLRNLARQEWAESILWISLGTLILDTFYQMEHVIREENRSWQHMTCLNFSVNWVFGVCLLHHHLVKTCPNFCSVFRWPLSGARTQWQSSRILWNAEISSVVEAHSLWQIWQVFALEKSRALGPCLFFSAHHSGYHPHA